MTERIFFAWTCLLSTLILAFVVYLLVTHAGVGYLAWNCANLLAATWLAVRAYNYLQDSA